MGCILCFSASASRTYICIFTNIVLVMVLHPLFQRKCLSNYGHLKYYRIAYMGCILCFSASASRTKTIPGISIFIHIVASSVSAQMPLKHYFIIIFAIFYLVASSDLPKCLSNIKTFWIDYVCILSLHPLFHRMCLSNPALEITISNIFNVASSDPAQVPLELLQGWLSWNSYLVASSDLSQVPLRLQVR